MTTETKLGVPRWIIFFGTFLAIFGLATGLVGIFKPTLFFNDFPNFTQWDDISFITNSWGVRNIALAVGLGVAIWLRSAAAIGAVFAMRFVNETGDLLNILTSDHGSFGLPAAALAVGWVACFMVPEALAAKWGLSRASI
ncbi:MAG: hypothetical protein ABJN69_03455 [Hellea sp.]